MNDTVIFDDIIVVSGLPRSGTSLVMQMLSAGGIPTYNDNSRVRDKNNPCGYFEHKSVKKLETDSSWLFKVKGQAVKIISHLIKHLPETYKYKVIFVQRNLDEVLVSQNKMLQAGGFERGNLTNTELLLYYKNHLQQITNWLNTQKNISLLYLDYSQIIINPVLAVGEMINFLKLDLNSQKMKSVIDPTLYRSKKIG